MPTSARPTFPNAPRQNPQGRPPVARPNSHTLPQKRVILSDQRESKDLRTIVTAKQTFSAKILRLRFTPLRMTHMIGSRFVFAKPTSKSHPPPR